MENLPLEGEGSAPGRQEGVHTASVLGSSRQGVPTSKTSNLAVLTLDHVFFSRATGLRFMPAAGNSGEGLGSGMGGGQHPCLHQVPTHSQMMAIMELKLPMLKHSRATSIKNSNIRVRCFFFTTCREEGRGGRGSRAGGLSAEPASSHWAQRQRGLEALLLSCGGPSRSESQD